MTIAFQMHGKIARHATAAHAGFTHTGQLRSLSDVVAFFNHGGAAGGTIGAKEIGPLDLTLDEQADVVAFLRTLTGPGPSPELLVAPSYR